MKEQVIAPVPAGQEPARDGGADLPRTGAPATATAREQTPLQRHFADYCESRIAVAGLVVLVLLCLLARLRALDRAAESLRPVAARHHGFADGTGRAIGGRRLTFFLGSDGQGRDMLSAIIYGLRISIGVGCRLDPDRARDRHVRRSARRLCRRPHRSRDHAHRRHPAVLPGHPARADPAGVPQARSRARSSSRWWRCSGPTTPAPRAARRWSSAARSTSRRPVAWGCRRCGSSSGTCCPTACRR